MSDLDDILNGDEGSEPIVEQVVEPVTEQPRADDGKFVAKGVEESAPPAPEPVMPPNVYEPLKAVRGENQQLKARLAEMERQLETIKGPPAPPPDIFEDTDGWQRHVTQNAEQMATERAVQAARLQTSELMLMREVPNLPEIRNDLMAFVGSNPAVNEQVASSPDPWRTAYQAFQTYNTMQEVGATDIETLKAKLREQLKAELATAPVNIPQSLAAEQSARGGSPAFAPPSLKEILGG